MGPSAGWLIGFIFDKIMLAMRPVLHFQKKPKKLRTALSLKILKIVLNSNIYI